MVKGLRIFAFAVTFFLLFFAVSCKEDKDSLAPYISIQLPHENATFNVYGKIPVVANINDDEIVESVEVSLYSQSDNRKVGRTQAYHVGSKNFHLNVEYTISDTLIPSGSYYIRIHAYDGNNIGYSFRTINISALARRKLYTMVLASDPSTSSIYIVDDMNKYTKKHSFGFQYQLSAVSNLEKILYMVDGSSNTLNGFDLRTNSILWNKVYPSANSSPEINYLTSDHNNNAAISLQTGYTERISAEGSLLGVYNTEIGMHPLKHFITEELAFLETSSNNMNTHQLEVFYTTAAGRFDIKNIDFEVMGICVSDEKYMLFVNKNGKAYLLEYSAQSKSITTIDELHNDSMEHVIQINDNEFVFSSSSSVYKYRKSSGSTISFAAVLSTDALAFDPLENEIYIASGQELFIYDYSSGQQKDVLVLPQNIREVYPIYNY